LITKKRNKEANLPNIRQIDVANKSTDEPQQDFKQLEDLQPTNC